MRIGDICLYMCVWTYVCQSFYTLTLALLCSLNWWLTPSPYSTKWNALVYRFLPCHQKVSPFLPIVLTPAHLEYFLYSIQTILIKMSLYLASEYKNSDQAHSKHLQSSTSELLLSLDGTNFQLIHKKMWQCFLVLFLAIRIHLLLVDHNNLYIIKNIDMYTYANNEYIYVCQ